MELENVGRFKVGDVIETPSTRWTLDSVSDECIELDTKDGELIIYVDTENVLRSTAIRKVYAYNDEGYEVTDLTFEDMALVTLILSELLDVDFGIGEKDHEFPSVVVFVSVPDDEDEEEEGEVNPNGLN